MLIAFLLPLMLAHAFADVPCVEARIPVEGAASAVFADLPPQFVRLEYLIKICAERDYISLRQTYADGKFIDDQAHSGLINQIYLPDNVDPAVVAGLPARVRIRRETGYRSVMSQAPALGELRFSSGLRLYSIQVARESIQSYYIFGVPRDARADRMPFLPLKVSLPFMRKPETVELVQTPPLRVGGEYFTLWTVRSPGDGFEQTALLQFGNAARVPLVEAYLADREGRLMIDAPREEDGWIYIDGINRHLHADSLFKEGETKPFTKEEWQTMERKSSGLDGFSGFFTGQPENAALAKVRDLFAMRIPAGAVLDEWDHFFGSADYHELWKDSPRARTYATVTARAIFFTAHPEYINLRGDLGESVENVISAAGQLIALGAISPNRLREFLIARAGVDWHPDAETECMQVISGLAGQNYGPQVHTAIRKAALNLELLRRNRPGLVFRNGL